MKEKNYSKQILDVLSVNLAGTTSKVIASYIGKDEPFTRVYLNRLKRRNKVEIQGKRGKFNIYHISARTGYEHRIEHLERENKRLKKLNEQWEDWLSDAVRKNHILKQENEDLKASLLMKEQHGDNWKDKFNLWKKQQEERENNMTELIIKLTELNQQKRQLQKLEVLKKNK